MVSMNQLVVIENSRFSVLDLSARPQWSVGRVSRDNQPDIAFESKTISRSQGSFASEDGIWFYSDFSRNGTMHNGVLIEGGLGGRIRSVMLEDGDILLFGSGNSREITEQTGFALYIEGRGWDNWRGISARDNKVFSVAIGSEPEIPVENPEKGTVRLGREGAVLFMGETIYLGGEASLVRRG